MIIGIQESLGTSTKKIVSILIKNLEKIKTCINTVLIKLRDGKINEAKTPRTSSRVRLRRLITDINTQLFPKIELMRRYLAEQNKNDVLIELDEIILISVWMTNLSYRPLMPSVRFLTNQ